MERIHFIEKSSGEFFTNAEREEVMLRCHRPGVLAALKQGLATAEHAAFVARLRKQAAKK